jgi:hypothetical protein
MLEAGARLLRLAGVAGPAVHRSHAVGGYRRLGDLAEPTSDALDHDDAGRASAAQCSCAARRCTSRPSPDRPCRAVETRNVPGRAPFRHPRRSARSGTSRRGSQNALLKDDVSAAPIYSGLDGEMNSDRRRHPRRDRRPDQNAEREHATATAIRIVQLNVLSSASSSAVMECSGRPRRKQVRQLWPRYGGRTVRSPPEIPTRPIT